MTGWKFVHSSLEYIFPTWRKMSAGQNLSAAEIIVWSKSMTQFIRAREM